MAVPVDHTSPGAATLWGCPALDQLTGAQRMGTYEGGPTSRRPRVTVLAMGDQVDAITDLGGAGSYRTPRQVTTGRIHDEPPMRTGRTQARVIVLARCVAVGVLWFSSAAEGSESFRPLTTLTVALAIIVGLSVAPKRSFLSALALAASAFGGLVLGAIMSGGFHERWSTLMVGTYAILLSAVVLSAWLVGAAIGHIARWVIVRRRT